MNRVQIETDEGHLLSAFHLAPTVHSRGNFRAVILVHGFAAEKTENGLFLEIGQALVERGYRVLMYDWRGLGESEGDFASTPLETHARDFVCVTKWLARLATVQISQICTAGFSLGAALITMAVRAGLRPGASAFWSPAVRPRLSMWPRYDTPQLREQLRRDGFVQKPDNRVRLGRAILESLRTTDLGSSAFDLPMPLLVCHGTDDARIPIAESRTAFQQTTSARVFFAEFEGASHSFRPEPHYRRSLSALFCQWLDKKELRKVRDRVVFPPGGTACRLLRPGLENPVGPAALAALPASS